MDRSANDLIVLIRKDSNGNGIEVGGTEGHLLDDFGEINIIRLVEIIGLLCKH